MLKVINLMKNVYNKNMFATNTATSMLLLGIGDGITQYIESVKSNSEIESSGELRVEQLKCNWKRTGEMVALGAVIGPLAHVWYGFLDRKFKEKTRKVILRKVLIDQLCFAPFLNITIIVVLHLLKFQQLSELKEYIKAKFLTIYLYDCTIWPAAQLFNFYYISPRNRVLYVNGITLVWNCILSYFLYNEIE